MDLPFPFGLPFKTAAYLTVYIATLLGHIVFVSYVLAGTGYMAACAIFQSRNSLENRNSSILYLLRDWMPFALSAAITAAIAPLLFVQTVYQQAFYTAHLLLYRRWLVVLPALIVAFYSLYLLKTKDWRTWSHPMRAITAIIALTCIVFTGLSWMQNHLLMLDQHRWAEVYLRNPFSYFDRRVLSRAVIVVFATIPIMATLIAWQLRYPRRSGPPATAPFVRHVAKLALGASLVAALAGVWHYIELGEIASNVWRPISWPYVFLGALAGGGGIYAWIRILRREELHRNSLFLASGGFAVAGLCGMVVREGIRLSSFDISKIETRLGYVAAKGIFVFILAFFVCAALIAVCGRIVRQGLQRASANSSATALKDTSTAE